jgi:hypothetical protein
MLGSGVGEGVGGGVGEGADPLAGVLVLAAELELLVVIQTLLVPLQFPVLPLPIPVLFPHAATSRQPLRVMIIIHQ